MSDIPVLVIGFNRPQFMQNLLDNLKDNGIKKLYVALDGPRNDNDIVHCRKTYEIVQSQNENFEIYILSRTYNLGCCLGVISALDWFFSVNDFGVIIEDDCLPDPEFYEIVSTKIKDWAGKSSTNLELLTAHNPFEFNFENKVTRSVLIHGWATDSNVWRKVRKDFFKLTLPSWKNSTNERRPISSAFYWWANSTRAKLGLIDTWDGIFADNSWRQGVSTIMPDRNLVRNLGYGPSGTHTKNITDSNLVKLPLKLLQNYPLDYLLDRYYFKIKKNHIVKSVLRVVLDIIKFPKAQLHEKRLIQDISDRLIELP